MSFSALNVESSECFAQVDIRDPVVSVALMDGDCLALTSSGKVSGLFNHVILLCITWFAVYGSGLNHMIGLEYSSLNKYYLAVWSNLQVYAFKENRSDETEVPGPEVIEIYAGIGKYHFQIKFVQSIWKGWLSKYFSILHKISLTALIHCDVTVM